MENDLEGFKLLLNRKVDAVATNQWVGAYTIQSYDLDGIRHLKKPFASKVAPMAVKKGNTNLLNQLDRGIRILKKEKILDQVLEDWSSQQVVFITKERITQLQILSGFFIFVFTLGVGIFWVVSLILSSFSDPLECSTSPFPTSFSNSLE